MDKDIKNKLDEMHEEYKKKEEVLRNRILELGEDIRKKDNRISELQQMNHDLANKAAKAELRLDATLFSLVLMQNVVKSQQFKLDKSESLALAT